MGHGFHDGVGPDEQDEHDGHAMHGTCGLHVHAMALCETRMAVQVYDGHKRKIHTWKKPEKAKVID